MDELKIRHLEQLHTYAHRCWPLLFYGRLHPQNQLPKEEGDDLGIWAARRWAVCTALTQAFSVALLGTSTSLYSSFFFLQTPFHKYTFHFPLHQFSLSILHLSLAVCSPQKAAAAASYLFIPFHIARTFHYLTSSLLLRTPPLFKSLSTTQLSIDIGLFPAIQVPRLASHLICVVLASFSLVG